MGPRLFIVDDEAPAQARLITLLSDIAGQCPHQLVGTASHSQQALDEIARSKPDIVLLDVQMPGMTGLELARHLTKTLPVPPAVIFITAYDEYALKAFDVHALDYLLKPVRATRLAEALQRVWGLRAQALVQTGAANAAAGPHSRRQHFSVLERGRVLLVPIDEVIYLKAELKYVTLRTRGRDYLIEESLMSIEEELRAAFVRVHRNALVARSAILGVEKSTLAIDTDGEQEKAQESWQVILRDIDDRLPISRRQWPIVKALVR